MQEAIPSVEMPQAQLSGAERQEMGRKRAGQRVIEAMALLEKTESERGDPATIAAQVKAMCLAAMPRVMGNLIAIATGTGKHAKAPAVAQTGAAKLVAGAAGIALEAAPGSAGAIPLAEMGLGDLEGTLTSMLANIQTMRAIEGQAQRIDSPPDSLPQQGTTPAGEQPPG